jgi:CheY-like chemotaxis protein
MHNSMNKPVNESDPFDILLVEPADLLRRTVSLTVRSLGTADVTEAATYPTAQQFCARRAFDGAVIALDWPFSIDNCQGLSLIQQVRSGHCASPSSIPIAVLVESCDAELLGVLRGCAISRVLIKPFRVRDVIDTIGGMRERARAGNA